MADILIRGMEMPEDCDKCKLCALIPVGMYGLYRKCMPLNRNAKITVRRKDCPLHELPEHGDLIDRDALKHKFCTHCDGYEYDTGACVDGDQDCMDAKIIMTAPVIVPSNKEETE